MRLRTVVSALCLAAGAVADFVTPDSSKGDFYQSWKVGDDIDIRWNAGWSWGKGTQPDVVDLFVMWFDNPTAFSQLLLANVSLAKSGNYTWTVDISNAKVVQQPKFVFRFSQHTEPEAFDMDLPRLPSRGFILSQKASSSSSTSSSSSSASSTATKTETSVSSAESTPATQSSAAPSTSPAPGKKSNKAAIAAGVLGGLVGIALVLGGVLFLLRRARKRREAEVGEGEAAPLEDHKGPIVYAYQAQELPTPPSELPGDQSGHSRELNGSTPTDWH